MPEVRAYECEECHTLGRAESYEVGEDDSPAKPHTAYCPPDGWLYVSVQRIGVDADPAKVFCSDKCMGLHYRPVIRRKGGNGDAPEEGHSEE